MSSKLATERSIRGRPAGRPGPGHTLRSPTLCDVSRSFRSRSFCPSFWPAFVVVPMAYVAYVICALEACESFNKVQRR